MPTTGGSQLPVTPDPGTCTFLASVVTGTHMQLLPHHIIKRNTSNVLSVDWVASDSRKVKAPRLNAESPPPPKVLSVALVEADSGSYQHKTKLLNSGAIQVPMSFTGWWVLL